MRLLLMSLVFILVTSCSTNQKESIEFKCKNNSIVLDKNEYQITKHKKYIELKILTESKLDLIRELMECSIILNLDNKRHLVKALNTFESRVPKGCDYFFTEYDNGCIVIQDEQIFIRSIDI